MEAAVFDIETTGLGAVGSGMLLCVCVRPLRTGRTRVFRLDNYEFKPSYKYGIIEREEKALLTDVRDELIRYHILIGHNIVKYDTPFLISRAYQLNLTWPVRFVLYDTLRAFRRTSFMTMPNGFGKPSAGLDMVIDFGKIKQEKTKIYPNEWWSALWGNHEKRAETMNSIVDHCARDVRMNAQVFEFLWAADAKPQLVKTG